MSDPYIGEIRRFPYSAIPNGWLPCDGRLVPISQNQALMALLGFTYGGDGRDALALPDLRGRTPVHQDGAAGPIGAIGYGPGPLQPYLTLIYAIATGGDFPPR